MWGVCAVLFERSADLDQLVKRGSAACSCCRWSRTEPWWGGLLLASSQTRRRPYDLSTAVDPYTSRF